MHNGGKEKEGQALGKNSLFRTCCVSTGMQPTEAGPHSALLTQLLLTWKWKRRFSRFSTNHRKRGNVCTGCWSLDRPVCDRSCVRSRSFARLSLYSFFLPFFLSFFFFSFLQRLFDQSIDSPLVRIRIATPFLPPLCLSFLDVRFSRIQNVHLGD